MNNLTDFLAYKTATMGTRLLSLKEYLYQQAKYPQGEIKETHKIHLFLLCLSIPRSSLKNLLAPIASGMRTRKNRTTM